MLDAMGTWGGGGGGGWFALVCTNIKGNVHVPAALKLTNKEILSFGHLLSCNFS